MHAKPTYAILASVAVLGAMGSGAVLKIAAQGRTDGVTITFLANEGVMLSAGGRKVLIDALFLKYGPEYAVPADSTLASLQRARIPFDSVDVILVTRQPPRATLRRGAPFAEDHVANDGAGHEATRVDCGNSGRAARSPACWHQTSDRRAPWLCRRDRRSACAARW